MNNKNSNTYSIVLLMSLFLCSIEMNAMMGSSHREWLLNEHVTRHFYNEKVEPLREQIKNDLNTELDITKKALEVNKKELEQYKRLKEEVLQSQADCVDQAYCAKKLDRIDYIEKVLDLAGQKLDEHIKIMDQKRNNIDGYIKFLHWNVLVGNKLPSYDSTEKYYNDIENYKSRIKMFTPDENADGGSTYGQTVSYLPHSDDYFDNMIMHKLDNIDQEISEEMEKTPGGSPNSRGIAEALGLDTYATSAPSYLIEPTIMQTLVNRFKKWWNGEQSSMFGFVQHPPQKIEQIQQASMRERNFPPTPALTRWRKEVLQGRHSSLH